ncbi:carbohydrate-binding protein [Kribbella sp. CA-293567]|uniref:carbohydrate-binding protein n=1 Tax=Kribbella sp. CA-293567 TaxID=3002436 RepID=UPI0022DDF009|nr:carbohydrate-binding protein [Kribbella sp. CA-293567]WBQ03525.1 carbohydrate-binding protein [Kribbella sp. CA-293567]
MRRSISAAVVIALAAGSVIAAAGLPATASRPDRGAAVTGTYSSGPTQAWQPLPTSYLGRDQGGATDATVVIDPSILRQKYSGVGFSLDETSVSNLWKLTPAERDRAIRLLVDPKTGAGLDRFRLTIGSPDLIEHLPFWSYDELPAGVTEDFGLKYFSIKRDLDAHIVDTVKLIQRYNPKATFFASAWSAPAWMKTNNRFTGEVALRPGSTSYYQVGKLRDDCIDVFARYYVKFLQAYARHGVHVDALTLLNEPGIDVVYPAMDISIEQQQKLAVAIKREVKRAGLDTELYVHDFNFWDWRDPNSTETKNYHRILNDPSTRRATDAIAFHPYWGDPAVMRDAYEQTGKPVHMTETSDLSPATILNYFRLDASSYVMWAQATDQDGGTLHWTPSRDNDVDWAEVGRTSKWPNRLVKVDTTSKTFTVRDELYAMGQFAKYLGPEHTRVESSATANGVSNVIYRDRRDNFVAIVGNSNPAPASVRVVLGGKSFTATVPANSYATYRWHGEAPSPHRNHAPVLGAVPEIVADQYATTQLQLKATDRDRDRLSYYAKDLPAGVSVDGRTGLVTLHPTVAGKQDFKVRVTDGAAHDEVTVKVTVTPRGTPIGERVEAESYVAQFGWTDGGANFVESNPSASGGKNIGWTAAGNWLQYRVDVAAAGTYNVEFRVANGTGAVATDAISLRDASGAVLAKVSVPLTGGWATYESVNAQVTLPAGDQLVTVFCEAGGFNLDYLRLTV